MSGTIWINKITIINSAQLKKPVKTTLIKLNHYSLRYINKTKTEMKGLGFHVEHSLEDEYKLHL